MELKYVQYDNVIKFATKWRGYDVKSPIMDETEFHKASSIHDYIRIDCVDNRRQKHVVIFMLLNSKAYKAAEIRGLLNSVKQISEVIIISLHNIATPVSKLASRFNHLNISTYGHHIFAMEIPKGPHCYPHRIMDKKEVTRLLNEGLMTRLTGLSQIRESDPQCIWIGAQIGDVIEIDAISAGTGIVKLYKIVSSNSARANSRRVAQLEEDKKDEEENVDSDTDSLVGDKDDKKEVVDADALYILDDNEPKTDDEEAEVEIDGGDSDGESIVAVVDE